MGLGEEQRFLPWAVACCVVLALTGWAVHRLLQRGGDAADGGEPVLALICVAMFGLVVSPVSWSHHWVWMLPTVIVTAVVGYRRRRLALLLVSAAGLALMVWTPITLLPEHHETAASLWRKLAGGSYLWWALIVIAVAGATAPARGAVGGNAPKAPKSSDTPAAAAS